MTTIGDLFAPELLTEMIRGGLWSSRTGKASSGRCRRGPSGCGWSATCSLVIDVPGRGWVPMADSDEVFEVDLDDEGVAAAVQRMRDDERIRILANPAGHLADRIVEVADVVRGEGSLAARPGQMARLEKAADQLVALADEVRGVDTP